MQDRAGEASASNPFELRPFSRKSLEETRAKWEKQLKSHQGEVMPTEYTRLLDWAARNMAYETGETFAYGVFPRGEAAAVAIAEILYTRAQRKWLKFLNLTLSPEYDVGLASDAPDLIAIGHVFAAAISGTVGLTRVHKSRVTKLYGRSGTMLSFLKGLSAHLQANQIEGVEVTVEGRWLVIRVKEGG